MPNSKTHRFAPVVLRLGLSMVMVWFGLNQLLQPDAWLSFIPAWATSVSHLSTHTFVLLNGLFEVVAAILLACGIKIRIVASLLFLHMITIVGDVGLSAIGVRDIGIAVGLLSIALHGSDAYSFDI